MPLLRDKRDQLDSPYLLSHVDNPVDWWQWGDDAFARAVELDRPVFLSIGYAACHWCHVMAHESFEDPSIAALINERFIAIKVDREERPDVDAVYMAATQIVSGNGGWPMTVFLTPRGQPFMAGTYYPPVDRSGMPGLTRLLLAMDDAWREQRGAVNEQVEQIAHALAGETTVIDRLPRDAPTPTWPRVARRAADQLLVKFDPLGGFTSAPKFPRPSFIEAMLPFVDHAEVHAALATTLDAMSREGLYDHLRGGFARYSVDERWHVPHFEKMLSDQALLALAYLRAARACADQTQWRDVALGTLRFVENDLAVAGGYAASLDADSDGREGAHVTWTRDDVVAALDGVGLRQLADHVCARYRIVNEGEFEGRSIPRLARDESFRTPEDLQPALDALRRVRAQRPQPVRDEKIILEWNAMYAVACLESNDEHFIDVGMELVSGLPATHFYDGEWWRTSAREAYATASDVAWYVEALVSAFEITGDDRWTNEAGKALTYVLDNYWDGEVPTSDAPSVGGGLFTTSRQVRDLITRPKEIFDGATPSAHAVATRAFARYGLLVGADDAMAVAQRLVQLAASLLDEHPVAVVDLVNALGFVDAGREIVIPGDDNELRRLVRSMFVPASVLVVGGGSSPLLRDRLEGFAYVCRRRVCQLPVRTTKDLRDLLANSNPMSN